MIAVNSWGKKIYVDDELNGYIAPSGDMYTKDGQKFGSLSDRGDIYINYEPIGYISDDYCLIINDMKAGEVDEEGNFRFDSLELNQSMKTR